MSRFAVIERASIDEAYMDLTAAVQQRLKDLNNGQIQAHLLKATYVQGFPPSPPERPAATEDVAHDRGISQPDVGLISCCYWFLCGPMRAGDQTKLFPLFLPRLEEQRARGLQQWLAMLPLPAAGEQSSAELQLAVGALIVEEMRAAVEKDTGFRCSAGISHNKVGTAFALFLQSQHSVSPNC